MGPVRNVFEFTGYVDFLHAALSGGVPRARKPRGSIRALAEHLQCHSSFVAQVLGGRANFSVDQALGGARYFRLDEASTDHFLDLVQLERAGTPDAKRHFRARIEARRKAISDLGTRWNARSPMPEKEAWTFFSSWLLQTVYSLLHIVELDSPSRVAQRLGVSVDRVESALSQLERARLVRRKGGRWVPLKNWLHLSKESPIVRIHHQSWRQRAMEEFARSESMPGLHYSGSITVTRGSAEAIRKLALAFLDEVRKEVAGSESKEGYAVLLDFFPLA